MIATMIGRCIFCDDGTWFERVREFGVSEFIGSYVPKRPRDSTPSVMRISDADWVKLWTRLESDENGEYVDTAWRLAP